MNTLSKIEKSGNGSDVIKIKYVKPATDMQLSDEEIIDQIQTHLYPNMTSMLLSFVLINKFKVKGENVPPLIKAIKKRYGQDCIIND